MPDPAGVPVLRPQRLPRHTLSDVAARLGVPLPDGAGAGTAVTGLTHDSRSVRAGDLYAALPGARAHGAQFAADVRDAGAVAALTDQAGEEPVRAAGLPAYVVADPRGALGDLAAWVYGEPGRDLTLVGVTGTNGKTTTAYLLEAGLQAAGRATGLVGTIETRIGDEVVPSVRTTPEAPDLQALLAVMRERGAQAIPMEVSSHALALGRVDGLTYDIAIFTNLSEDHLDFHADLEDYFAVKASLFTPSRSDVGVVAVDDDWGRRLARTATVPVTTVSVHGNDADWRVDRIAVAGEGSSFRLTGPDGAEVTAGTALPGEFNVDNAALAVVALVQTGIDLAVAAKGVAACSDVPGRMERVDEGQDFLALVDYAHTPDALTLLLATARRLTRGDGRVVVVVGCGGDRDPYKRPVMGEIAARGADLAILTSDNPRSEDPLAILEAMREGAGRVGAAESAQVTVQPDRRAAIGEAVAAAGAGDVLVVAGKGHEQGQEIAGSVHPFDDRTVLREALGAATR